MIPMFGRMGSVWAESQVLAAARAKAPRDADKQLKSSWAEAAGDDIGYGGKDIVVKHSWDGLDRLGIGQGRVGHRRR
jgi:hypothetical protein